MFKRIGTMLRSAAVHLFNKTPSGSPSADNHRVKYTVDTTATRRKAKQVNFLHVSKELPRIETKELFGTHLPVMVTPKGVTLNSGTNAAKRYVERLASNNKEKRMLRSRLKRRMNELATASA